MFLSDLIFIVSEAFLALFSILFWTVPSAPITMGLFLFPFSTFSVSLFQDPYIYFPFLCISILIRVIIVIVVFVVASSLLPF